MAEKLSLYEKLLVIRNAMEAQEKLGHNTKQEYDYYSEAQVFDVLRKRFNEHKLWLMLSQEGFESRQNSDGKGAVRSTVIAKIKVRIQDTESSDAYEVYWYGEGYDNMDKAMPKAVTGAVKQCLLKTFMFTDEGSHDPDSTPRDDEEKAPDALVEMQKGKEKLDQLVRSTSWVTNVRKMCEEIGVPEAYVLEKIKRKYKLLQSFDDLDEKQAAAVVRNAQTFKEAYDKDSQPTKDEDPF